MEAILDQVLAFVEQILLYFQEGEGAAIVDMVKEFIGGLFAA